MENFGAFLKEKCMDFAVDIVNLYKHLCEDKKEYVLSKQMLRSGTSVGANLVEAQSGISRRDFIAKVFISLKECAETDYWLELLYRTNYLTKEEYETIKSECEELNKILTSIAKNSRN